MESIAACLDSVLSFEVPAEWDHEILVVDGMSSDKTREIVRAYIERYPRRLRLVNNPKRITPCAMNVGVGEARGEFVAILSAHATYPKSYLVLCLDTMERTGADNVGGGFETQQNGDSYSASLVQALTTHPFGVGRSYRTGTPEGPADTVAYGFYRKCVFARIGLFDERLARAQDYEFNRRLAKSGGRIWLNPKIRIFYKNQKSLFRFYRKQACDEGPYNAYLWYLAPYAFTWRHAVTGAFSGGVIAGFAGSMLGIAHVAGAFYGILTLYFGLAIVSAVQQAVRYKRPLHVFTLPVCFFLYHFLHGLGIWAGIARLALGRSPVQRDSRNRASFLSVARE